MPVSVTIDGNSIVIDKGSLSIERRIEERSTASFNVVDIIGAADYVRGMPVLIYDPDVTLIFAGFIDDPGRARMGVIGSHLLHNITCMDNHDLADKRLIVKSYTDKTLEYIVEDILTDSLVAEGVSEGEIQTGPTISEATFNYVRVSEAFDALKELSGFTWYIDELKKLYFIDRTTNIASWNLDNSTYKPIKGSVHLSKGNPLYRNRQYIKGGTGITAVQTGTFTGDTVMKAFTVGYPIAQKPVVTANGGVVNPNLVGIKGIDTGMTCYWNKGDATITFEAPPDVNPVIITYYGLYPLIVRADSYTDILARLAIEGNSGIV